MKKLKLYIILLAVFLISGCSKSYEKYINTYTPVTGVYMENVLHSIEPGKSMQMTAFVLPDNAPNRGVKWSITGNDKITIDSKGLVSVAADAVPGSSATLVVTTIEKNIESSFIGIIKVWKKPPDLMADTVTIKPMQLNYVQEETINGKVEKVVGIEYGQKYGFTKNVTPDEAIPSSTQVSWSVTALDGNPTDLIKVNPQGLIEAIKPVDTDQYAKVIATLSASPTATNKTAEHIIKVLAPVKPTALAINNKKIEEITAETGKNYYLIPSFTPNKTADKTFKSTFCELSNFDEASLSCSTLLSDAKMDFDHGGQLYVHEDATPNSKLVMILTANANPGIKAVAKINIAQGITKVSAIEADGNNTFKLAENDDLYGVATARINYVPVNTTQRGVNWVSDNPNIAQVDDKGKITAIKAGNTKIIATSKYNANLKTEFNVFVAEKYVYIDSLAITPRILSSGSVSVFNASGEISEKVEKPLLVKINESATYKDLTYFSTNDNVVQVEYTGGDDVQPKAVITGFGSAEIYAISQRGKKTDKIKVSVININPTAGASSINPEQAQSPSATSEEKKQLQMARSVHRIKLPKGSPTWEIGQTAVTYKLWEAVYAWATTEGADSTGTPNGKRLMDAGSLYKFKTKGFMGSYGVKGYSQYLPGGDMQPVTSITWRDAVIWCNAYTEWLNYTKGIAGQAQRYYPVYIDASGEPLRDSTGSQLAGDHPIDKAVKNSTINLSKNGMRLPTKTEWLNIVGNNGQTGMLGKVSDSATYLSKAAWTGDSTLFAYAPHTRSVAYIAKVVDKWGTEYDINTCNNDLRLCDVKGNTYNMFNDIDTNTYRAFYTGGSYATNIGSYSVNEVFKNQFTALSGFFAGTETNKLFINQTQRNDIGFRIARTITTNDPAN